MKRAAIAGFLLLALASVARAQDAPPDPFLTSRLQPGATLERYLQTLRAEFIRIDADGDGKIDAADLAIHVAVSESMLRTSFAMQIMAADLDGDGAVTADEMRRKLRYDRRNPGAQSPNPSQAAAVQQQIDAQIERWMQADADKDGRVTWQEAIEAAKKQPNYARAIDMAAGQAINQILALAPDDKKSLTLPQFEAKATAFFRAADTDNNGTISSDEAERLQRAANQLAAEVARQRALEAKGLDCEMPKASPASKVLLLGAYETDSLSTVALGSQDEVTGVGNVAVEAGSEPLYLVIASYRPTIWRFSGSTERIERVVVLAQRSWHDKTTNKPVALAGVVGLPADKVSFPKRTDCMQYFHEVPSVASAQAAGVVRVMAGKAPDVVAGKYELNTFHVPSARIEAVKNDRPRVLVIQKSAGTLTIEGDPRNIQVVTPNGNLERELLRFNPGGVVAVEADKVVASVKAEPYEVLPEQAGLIQLVQSGALTQNRMGEFLINRKIRYPAGLAGAHSVKFLLRRGVPAPDGSPGHSCVMSEEAGQAVANANLCR